MPIAATSVGLMAWLDTAVNHEMRGDFSAIKLERIRDFMRWLPPVPSPCIIAGTKGKGSTARLIEAVLVAHGEKTITFMSPHVLEVRERWRCDGRDVDYPVLSQTAEMVAALEITHHVMLSWYERTFAMACILASQRPNTRFIIEVGLGGRLDCANVLDAAVAVLTHVSHDHRDVLGPTVHHIVREKIAVSRAGKPLIVAPQTPSTHHAIMEVFRGISEHERPRLQCVDGARIPIELLLLGAHQQNNAATALLAAQMYVPGIDTVVAQEAMAHVALPARCQLVVWHGRRILIDGAHNGPSVAATISVAQKELRSGWSLAIGMAKDKELDEIQAVIPADIKVVRVGYHSSRARSESDWSASTETWPWFPCIEEAIHHSHGDLCITGSFYLAGEALAKLVD